MNTTFVFLILYCVFVVGAIGISPLHDDILPNGARPTWIHKTSIDEITQVTRFRLPTNLIPTYYRLHIRPILKEGSENQFTAPANVEITLKCRVSSYDIVLHASELHINTDEIRIWNKHTPNENIPVNNVTTNDINQIITFHLGEELLENEEYIIKIFYIARIPHPSERMNGLYRSSYKTADGKTRWLATTQFSRTRAFRKMLPSYDEPTHKAVFEISIGREKEYHALSNMNITKTEPIFGMDNWYWDHFAPTPIMPPTVIAMIISDFDSEEAEPGIYDKPVAIWGPPPKISKGDAKFAAEAVAETLKRYDEYFGIPYELPKMDSAGIADFAAGAMENWGLNIYREGYMFWNKEENTAAAKYGIANVVSHELAHQWWGNLVTHTWWNDWWLTEGFASYYQYVLFNEAYPEFTPLGRMLTDDVQIGMAFDITPGSVPVHGNNSDEFIENPSQINYNKGAGLVRMMNGFLSEVVFKRACIYYLKNRSYTAVDQYALFHDLQFSIQEQGASPINGRTMTEIMDTWTLQTGLPIVTVGKFDLVENYMYFLQESFQQNHKLENELKTWYIPISYVSKSNPSFQEPNILPKFWMNKNEIIVVKELNNTDEWIVVNPDARGYYRVLYDTHFGSLLKNQLLTNINSISESSRSQIVDDYLSAAYENYTTFENAVSMTEFIKDETAYSVWIPFLKHFKKPYTLFASNLTQFQMLKDYMTPKVTKVITDIGLEQPEDDEPILNRILRVNLLDWLCGMDDADCLSYAKRLIDEWRFNPQINPVPVDLRTIVYCAAVAEGSEENWKFLKNEYIRAKDNSILNSFRCTSRDLRIEELLNEAQNETFVPRSETWTYLSLLSNHKIGREYLLTFLELRLSSLVEYVGSVSGLNVIFSSMATFVSSTDEVQRIEKFVKGNEQIFEEILPQIKNSLKVMEDNRNWMLKIGYNILNAIY